MAADPLEELLSACASFVRAHRELAERVSEIGPATRGVAVAMTAELDRLEAAVRRAQEQSLPGPGHSVGGDPGE
jgi:hypothetical protein